MGWREIYYGDSTRDVGRTAFDDSAPIREAIVRIRLKTLLLVISPLLLLVAAAYVQWGNVGVRAIVFVEDVQLISEGDVEVCND